MPNPTCDLCRRDPRVGRHQVEPTVRARVRCPNCKRYVFEMCEPGGGYRHVRCVLGHVQIQVIENSG